MVALRHEMHYGDRVVRCFAERPAHIDAMFRAVAARHPQRDALVLGSERITYKALDEQVEAVAGNLAQRGFQKGDRLALLLGNCFEFVIAVLAAARAGIIVVPMSTRQRAPETEFILTQCEAAGLIYQGDLAEHLPARAALPHLRECSWSATDRAHRSRNSRRPALRRPSASPRKTSSRCSIPRAPPAARRARCSRTSARSTR